MVTGVLSKCWGAGGDVLAVVGGVMTGRMRLRWPGGGWGMAVGGGGLMV